MGIGNATHVLNSLKMIELFEYYRPQVLSIAPFEPKFGPRLGPTHGVDASVTTDDAKEQSCSWE